MQQLPKYTVIKIARVLVLFACLAVFPRAGLAAPSLDKYTAHYNKAVETYQKQKKAGVKEAAEDYQKKLVKLNQESLNDGQLDLVILTQEEMDLLEDEMLLDPDAIPDL